MRSKPAVGRKPSGKRIPVMIVVLHHKPLPRSGAKRKAPAKAKR